jgi:hypothetical protein
MVLECKNITYLLFLIMQINAGYAESKPKVQPDELVKCVEPTQPDALVECVELKFKKSDYALGSEFSRLFTDGALAQLRVEYDTDLGYELFKLFSVGKFSAMATGYDAELGAELSKIFATREFIPAPIKGMWYVLSKWFTVQKFAQMEVEYNVDMGDALPKLFCIGNEIAKLLKGDSPMMLGKMRKLIEVSQDITKRLISYDPDFGLWSTVRDWGWALEFSEKVLESDVARGLLVERISDESLTQKEKNRLMCNLNFLEINKMRHCYSKQRYVECPSQAHIDQSMDHFLRAARFRSTTEFDIDRRIRLIDYLYHIPVDQLPIRLNYFGGRSPPKGPDHAVLEEMLFDKVDDSSPAKALLLFRQRAAFMILDDFMGALRKHWGAFSNSWSSQRLKGDPQDLMERAKDVIKRCQEDDQTRIRALAKPRAEFADIGKSYALELEAQGIYTYLSH